MLPFFLHSMASYIFQFQLPILPCIPTADQCLLSLPEEGISLPSLRWSLFPHSLPGLRGTVGCVWRECILEANVKVRAELLAE